jgi:DUF971 family protein
MRPTLFDLVMVWSWRACVGYSVNEPWLQPEAIDIKRDRGVTIQWRDGTGSYYTVAYLRRNSPSADQRQLRDEMANNPLAVIPSGQGSGPLTITDAQFVGNYALKLAFSDGHETGIYSWRYLREIDPAAPGESPNPSPQPGSGSGPEPEDNPASGPSHA